MNGPRLKGFLGLSVRAGQAVFGTDTCERLLLSGQGGILLMDAGASENSRKKCRELCERTGTAFALVPAGMITEATGRDNRVMALRKGTFSEQVTGCL